MRIKGLSFYHHQFVAPMEVEERQHSCKKRRRTTGRSPSCDCNFSVLPTRMIIAPTLIKAAYFRYFADERAGRAGTDASFCKFGLAQYGKLLDSGSLAELANRFEEVAQYWHSIADEARALSVTIKQTEEAEPASAEA